MQAKVQLWGNSLALRIPKYIANQMKINNGSNVDVLVEQEKLIVKPISNKQELLDQLLAKITENNIHSEEDFGNPMGEEVW